MRRGAVLVLVLLALAGAAAWLALGDGAPGARGVASKRGPSASPDVRPDAELAAAGPPAVEGEPASAERVAVAPPAAAAGKTFAVVIQDGRGTPVGGVPWAIFRGAEVLARGVTEADGVASFADAGEAALAAAPLARPPQVFALASALERQVVTLAEGAAVAGTVLVEGLPPEERIELWLAADRELFSAEALPPEVWQALDLPAQSIRRLQAGTAGDGIFRFEGLAAGSAGQLSWPKRFLLAEADTGARSDPLRVQAPVEDLVVRLVPCPALTGRVVMPGTGEPVPKARMSLVWADVQTSTESSARAQEDGSFCEFFPDGLPARIAVTVAEAEGGGSQRYEFDIPLGLSTYDTGPLTILPTRTVAFVVRDAKGAPIEGAVATELRTSPGERARAVTDALGQGTLRLASAARALRVIAAGCEPAEVPLPPGAGPLEITLRQGTLLEVRLTPVSADLSLRFVGDELPFEGAEGPSPIPETKRVRRMFRAGSITFQAPEDGIYVFTGVRQGVALTLSVVDAGGIAVLEQDVPPLAAGEHRVVELAVPLERRTLAGRVRSEDGSPVQGASVMVGAVGSEHLSGPGTDEDGRFRIEHLAASRVRLVVTHPDHAPLLVGEQEVAEEPPLELVLERGHGLRVAVHGPDGRPVPTASVVLSAGDPPWKLPVPPLTAGAFTFEHVPREPLALAVTAGGRTFERSLAASSAPAEVEIEIPAWQSCTVLLEGSPEAPVDVHYYADLNLPGGVLQQREHAEGRRELRFDVVYPGRYEVFAGAWFMDGGDQRWSEIVPLDVTLDAPASLTLKLRAP